VRASAARAAAEIEIVETDREHVAAAATPCRVDNLGGERALAAAWQAGQADQPWPRATAGKR
jgi:hypothetical protein